MRKAVDSSEASRHLGEIGEILSLGVELLLRSREQSARQQKVEEAAQEEELVPEVREPKDGLLELAAKFGSISTADAMENAGMTRSTARRRLAELVASGALVAEGKGRGAHYRLPTPNRKQ